MLTRPGNRVIPPEQAAAFCSAWSAESARLKRVGAHERDITLAYGRFRTQWAARARRRSAAR